MRYIAFVLFFFFSLTGNAQGILFEEISFDEALAKAKEQNKRIFVELQTSWCGNCRRLEKEVFTNDTIGTYFNKNFVNLSLDAEQPEGYAIASTFGVAAYPTLLFLDSQGIKMMHSVGFKKVNTLKSIANHTAYLKSDIHLVKLIEKLSTGNSEKSLIPLMEHSKDFYSPEWPDVIEDYFNGSSERIDEQLDFLKSSFSHLTIELKEHVLNSLKIVGIFSKSRKDEIGIQRKIESDLDHHIVRASKHRDEAHLLKYLDLKQLFLKRTKPNFSLTEFQDSKERMLLDFYEKNRRYSEFHKTTSKRINRLYSHFSGKRTNDSMSISWLQKETYELCRKLLQMHDDERVMEDIIRWSEKAIELKPKSIHYLQKAKALLKKGQDQKVKELIKEASLNAVDAEMNRLHFDLLLKEN